MAADRELQDFQFTAGQNEGIEAAFLQPPMLAQALNVRLQKPGRFVKRNGCSALPTIVSAPFLSPGGGGPGATTVLGTGNQRGVLSKGIVIDEQLYLWDSVAQQWRIPAVPEIGLLSGSSLPHGTALPASMPAGQMPNFQVEGSIFAARHDSTGQANATPACDSLFAFGYVFLAYAVTSQVQTFGVYDSLIRVTAFDPATGVQVFTQDIQSNSHQPSAPRLLLMAPNVNPTIVVVFLDAANGSLRGSSMTGATIQQAFATGFIASAQITLTGGAANAGFDASNFVGNGAEFLVSYQSAGAQITSAIVTIFGFTIVSSANTATSAGVMRTAIVGAQNEAIYLTWQDAITQNIMARVFSATGLWTVLGATFALDASTLNFYRPQMARIDPTTVLVAMGGLTPQLFPCMRVNVLTKTGTANVATQIAQANVYPFSRFTQIGSNFYIWCVNDDPSSGSLQRFAFLLRLTPPPVLALAAAFPVSYPVEAAMTEEIVALSAMQQNEGSWPQMCTDGTSYFMPLPVSISNPSPTQQEIETRVFKWRHGSNSVRTRSLSKTRRGEIDFVACSSCMEVDSQGSQESGFLFAPRLLLLSQTMTMTAGTHLTTTSTYQWTVVLFWRDANGNLCRSAPSAPIGVLLTGTNNQVSLAISRADVSARGQIEGRVYRTLANGGVFQYAFSVDLSPTATEFYAAVRFLGSQSVTDSLPDTAISANEVVYIQVGNELENRPPPACRFSTIGGNRIWIGGLASDKVIQASKQFRPGVGNEFADDDAFRLTLPNTVTALAWLDSLVVFTANAIYIVGGDGPGVDGVGAFQDPVQLPYPVGCIDYRSILVVNEGVFFQSARGLKLLPRGFGEPVDVDAFMDTLGTYPIITDAVVVETASPPEKTARWYCVDTELNPANGATLVYDLVHKIWTVDQRGIQSGATAPIVGAGQIDSIQGIVTLLESIAAYPTDAVVAAENSLALTGDALLPIFMRLFTGQMRLFGLMGHGPLTRVGVLASGQALPTTLSIAKTTNLGTGQANVNLLTTGAQYFWVEMGAAEQRDVTWLSLDIHESSVNVGSVMLHGFVLEFGKNQGGMLISQGNRVT